MTTEKGLRCPVCGDRLAMSHFGPFFTPDPVTRFAAECPRKDWRGPVKDRVFAAWRAAEEWIRGQG